MLKKSNIVLSSSYNSIPILNIPNSPFSNPSMIHCYPSQPKRKRPGRSLQRRRYATVESKGSSEHQTDDLLWPKLPTTNRLPSPYQILCIKRGDPYSKHRFYELVKVYHPDRKSHGNKFAQLASLSGTVRMERYRMVLAAHEILSDPAKRQAYDSNGAGWNDCSENGAPMYRWSQPKETKWSGFDTNDSPFRNATWEDWEKWYQRDKARQEPVYISNGGFLLLVVTAILFGAFGQSMRVEDYSNMFQRQVDMAHDDASKYLRRRKHDSIGLGNKDERLEHFLKSRDPYGHGVTNPTEERYRQMFIEPETCMSDGMCQAKS